MKNNDNKPKCKADNKYLYPTRPDHMRPDKVKLEPVSREIHHAVCLEIEYFRKRMQKEGRCYCPRRMVWVCDGDCGLCEYSTAGNLISLDECVNGNSEEITLADVLPDEAPDISDIIANAEMLDALHEELARLTDDERAICDAKGQGFSDRETARVLGITWDKFRWDWKKIKKRLYRSLKPYIYPSKAPFKKFYTPK